MSNWLIELQGEQSDIHFLSLFLRNTPFHIQDGSTAKALTLPGVAPNAESGAVQDAAITLVEIVNGAARLYNQEFCGVSFNKILRRGADGKWHGFGYLTLQPRSFELTLLNEDDETFGDWVAFGLSDDEVSRAFSLYGSLEPSWKNLYLVFEIIMDSVGGQTALEQKGWVHTSTITRFKQTANSFRAIGREARHTKVSFDPPSEPMSLEDAHINVRTLLSKWIGNRMSQSG